MRDCLEIAKETGFDVSYKFEEKDPRRGRQIVHQIFRDLYELARDKCEVMEPITSRYKESRML